MQQRTSAINVLDTSIIGRTSITLTHWTDTLEPEVAAGSSLEIGGSLFYATAADDIDVAGAWGGIGNSTLVYIYYAVSGTTATAELSTTAPTWDTAKQGWYDAGATKRCMGSIFKDGAGAYTQKTIFLDREHATTYQGLNLGIGANADRVIRVASDASILWDESEDAFSFNKKIIAAELAATKLTCYKYTDDVLLIQNSSVVGVDFEIKKPITAYLRGSASGVGPGFPRTDTLYIYQNSDWRTIDGVTVPAIGTYYTYNLHLNPGYYYYTCPAFAFGLDVAYLFCTGAFGLTTLTAADIVV